MTFKEFLRQFVPHGICEYSVRRHEYMRIGLNPYRASWIARSQIRYEQMREARLNLVPPPIISNLRTCVDAGAHSGSWTQSLLSLFHPPRVILVECEPRMVGALSAKFSALSSVKIIDAALAESEGVAPFHQLRHPAGSSLLHPRTEIRRELKAGSWDVVGTVQVNKISYDRLVAAEAEISILKLDIQGAELRVLANSREGLAKTRCVIMEVTFTPHYENDASFGELHAHMLSREFGLYRISPPYHRDGRVLYADAVYVREELLQNLSGQPQTASLVAA